MLGHPRERHHVRIASEGRERRLVLGVPHPQEERLRWRAVEAAEEGDVVLIAGKGHEQGQELHDRTIPFDDREVARDALRRLGATA